MKQKFRRKIILDESRLSTSLKKFPIVIKTRKTWERVSFKTVHGNILPIIKCLSKHPYYMVILPTLSNKRKTCLYVNYKKVIVKNRRF